jgi:hypothetical protein
MKHSFGHANVTTDTSASWTTLIDIDTTEISNGFGGVIDYAVDAWLSDHTSGAEQNGIVTVSKSGGVITIYSCGGPGGLPTWRHVDGAIYPDTTPEIEWVTDTAIVRLRVKCAQKLGSSYPGYNEHDRVLYGGTYYRCILTHSTSNTPPNATYWTVITDAGTYNNNTSYTLNQFVYWPASGNWWFADASISSGGGHEPETDVHWIALNDRGTWTTGTGALADAPTDFHAHFTWDRTV